jgi:hypothetical protein
MAAGFSHRAQQQRRGSLPSWLTIGEIIALMNI